MPIIVCNMLNESYLQTSYCTSASLYTVYGVHGILYTVMHSKSAFKHAIGYRFLTGIWNIKI